MANIYMHVETCYIYTHCRNKKYFYTLCINLVLSCISLTYHCNKYLNVVTITSAFLWILWGSNSCDIKPHNFTPAITYIQINVLTSFLQNCDYIYKYSVSLWDRLFHINSFNYKYPFIIKATVKRNTEIHTFPINSIVPSHYISKNHY